MEMHMSHAENSCLAGDEYVSREKITPSAWLSHERCRVFQD